MLRRHPGRRPFMVIGKNKLSIPLISYNSISPPPPFGTYRQSTQTIPSEFLRKRPQLLHDSWPVFILSVIYSILVLYRAVLNTSVLCDACLLFKTVLQITRLLHPKNHRHQDKLGQYKTFPFHRFLGIVSFIPSARYFERAKSLYSSSTMSLSDMPIELR